MFVLVWACSGGLIYHTLHKTITASIESELQNSTQTILNMVHTTTSTSIKNHLRAITDRNREIAEHFYEKFSQGLISEQDAKAMATEVLLSQTIGETGYLYCLKSNAVLDLHPYPSLVGQDVSQHDFVQKQITQKQGYIEYDWKNPGEKESRAKALYMTYFEPWDWIISASSYRSEFLHLIDIDDFRESVLALKFGRTGYSFVIDTQGNVVIHPEFKGNLSEKPFVQEMLAKKKGRVDYWWQNPGNKTPREKFAYFNHIPEYNWIVGSSGYIEEIYAPLAAVRTLFITTFLAGMLLIIPASFYISSTITKPLAMLSAKLKTDTVLASGLDLDKTSDDEIGQLIDYINSFVEQIREYGSRLEISLEERERLVHDLAIKNEELEEIIYASSHDLRSPVVNITGFSHELKKTCRQLCEIIKHSQPESAAIVETASKLEDEITSDIDFIIAGARKLDILQKGLLRISRLGRIELDTETININVLLDEIVKAMQYQIVQADVEVTIEHLPPCAGDLTLINQVFANLIDNAIKYRSPQRKGNIVITGKTKGNKSIYCASDNGIGISPDHQHKVFEIFHRLTPNSSIGGEGIGLTLAKRIVTRHKGRIWIESKPDQGSSFYVELPNTSA